MDIKTVGLVGAGTMGSGIAINIAQHGFSVRLVDTSDAGVAAAIAKAEKFYARQVERERMTADEAAEARARLSGGTDLAELTPCDLVIEAVFERIDVKAAVYEQLCPLLGESAILATNTSCLRVGALAEAVARPERFLGLHYFNPPAVNPIVEVVRGEKTESSVVDAALAFCKDTGKLSVVCRDSNGFALNRFFCPYLNESVRLYDEGVGTPFEIDRVAGDAFGAAAGPFVVMNLVGTRVALDAQRNLESLGSFYQPAESVVRVGEAGGQWDIGDPSPPDAARDKVIAERLMGATFLCVLQELDEDVAAAHEIDLGAQHALKFGKPPCGLMDELGASAVERLVVPLCETYGAAMPESVARVGGLVQ
ncbi:MAG: 3-hydroxyacyl-CoA dehydrogenase family protein [Alphaproteobacteria bacterium]|nr:3-hydroxyacyl-CoA dehydrogenase family protein [Alphaproteobacteria bacterium]